MWDQSVVNDTRCGKSKNKICSPFPMAKVGSFSLFFPRGYWFARVSAQKQQTSTFRLRPCCWKVFCFFILVCQNWTFEIKYLEGEAHHNRVLFFRVFQKAMTNQDFWNVIVIAYISKMGMKGAFTVGYVTLFKLSR